MIKKHPGETVDSIPRKSGLISTRFRLSVRDALPFLALFTACFAWFAFAADYVLFFQEKSALFIFPELVTETFSKPGGFLVSLSEMLTSFYFSPVAGSLVLAAVIALTAFVLSKTMLAVSGRNEKIYPFIITLLLFFLHTGYSFLLYNSTGILFVAWALYVAVRNQKAAKGFLPLIIFPVLYFLTGAFAWIWMLSVIAFAITSSRMHRFFIPFLVLVAASAVLVSQYIFFSDAASLAIYPLTLPDQKLHIVAYAAVLASVIMLPAVSVMRFPFRLSISMKYLTERIAVSLAVLASLSVIAFSTYDKKTRDYFRAEKLFYKGDYRELIRFNNENPSRNILTLFCNNIALAGTGLLNDRLFSFPQSQNGETLFLKWEMVAEKLKHGGNFYYEIGMINEAHRWAFENMTMKGLTPEGLKMLARTELINGHYNMAAKYISLLGKTLFYRKEAKRLEAFLFNDEVVMNDPELGRKRRINVRSEFFSLTDNPEINVDRIFATDSTNRAAFDYKVAWMMINKDYKGIESVLPLFGKLGYRAFPVHVEEVIMMIALSNNEKLPDPGGLQVRAETAKRWEQFLTLFQQYGSNPRNAEPALRKQFGNTFWYWAFYK